MKLHYWYARARYTSEVYSIIARTKREVEMQIERNGAANYDIIEQRTIEYTDGFDLFEQATSEGGGKGIGYHIKDGQRSLL